MILRPLFRRSVVRIMGICMRHRQVGGESIHDQRNGHFTVFLNDDMTACA
jgi:hypothetical protein